MFQLDQAGQADEENSPYAALCRDKGNQSVRVVRVKSVRIHYPFAETAAKKIVESWKTERNLVEEEEALAPLIEDETKERPLSCIRTPLTQKELHQDQESPKLEKDTTNPKRLTHPQTSFLLIQHQTNIFQLTGASSKVGATEPNPPKYTFLMSIAL